MTISDEKELDIYRKNKKAIIQLLKLGDDYAYFEGQDGDCKHFRDMIQCIENNEIFKNTFNSYIKGL